MELIKEIESKRDANGYLRRFGLFKCPYCLQEIERRLCHGLNQKSCGCEADRLKSIGMKGKKKSEEHKQKIRDNRKLQVSPMKGKCHTEKWRKEKSKLMKGKYSGYKHWNWQGGKSFEEYPQDFFDVRGRILERDYYQCQDPNCTDPSNILDCHHIDYDKKNNLDENLITLCHPCHSKTNSKNREKWTEFYQNIMRTKI